MGVKVKDCPFCGDRGRKRTIKWNILSKKTIDYIVECRNKECFIKPSTFLHYPKVKDKEEAIKRWNTRKGKDAGG